MDKREYVKIVSISCFLFALMVGCGGGGGGGGGSSSINNSSGESISYTGKTNQALINSNNADDIFLYAWGGGPSTFSTSMETKAASSSDIPNIKRVSGFSNQLFRKVKSATDLKVAKAELRAQEINETYNGTTSGTVTYSGSINEDGTGTLNIKYDNYNNGDGTTYNGDATLNIYAYDITNDLITDAEMSMTGLTFKSADAYFSLSGVIKIQNNFDSITNSETYNVNGRNETTKETFRFEYFTITQSYDNWFDPESCSETASGRVYIESEGYVDVSQTNPFIYNHYNQFNVNVPESGGPLFFNGTNSSKEKITPLSISQFEIEIDADGDGIYEVANTYLWSQFIGIVYTFETSFGTDESDVGYSVQATSDGGYIVTGYTNSNVYLVKTNAIGEVEWEKTFDAMYSDMGTSVLETDDGGFIVAGYSYPLGTGGEEIYVVRTDSEGNLLWEKSFSGADLWAYSIQKAHDGGFVIAGAKQPYSVGWKDAYLLKITSTGEEEWEKTFGGDYEQIAYSIKATSDGGYIMAGYSFDASVSNSSDNIYIIKTDSNGNMLWEKKITNVYNDYAYSVLEVLGGGYVIAGTSSNYGYLVKIDTTGNVLWEKSFSDTGKISSVTEALDGSLLVVGNASSEIYVIKTNKDGELLWEKIFDGITYSGYEDYAYDVQNSLDGGYVIVGYTDTFTTSSSQKDIYLIKTDSNGDVN